MFIEEASAPAARPADSTMERRTQDADAREPLVEQVRLLHQYSLLTQLLALINSGILAYVQWSVMSRGVILAWLAGSVVVSLARLAQAHAFAKASPDVRTIRIWRNRFLLGAAASGILWGAAGLLLFPAQSLAHQVFTSFVIAGMIAGSVATLAPVLAAYILFAVPAMIPILLQFLVRGGEVYFSISVMTLLYGLAMLAVARHVNGMLRHSFNVSRRNSELVDVLTTAKAHGEALNMSLQDEVAERRQTEQALRDSEALLTEAQRMAHLGSWSYETQTHHVVWSEEMFRIYGAERSRTIPSCRELIARIHETDRQRMVELVQRAVDGGEASETEFRILTPGRETRWIHAMAQPQTDAQGRTYQLRGTVADITERKQQTMQLESERRVLEAIATGAPLPSVLELLCNLVEGQWSDARCAVHLLDPQNLLLLEAAAPNVPPIFRLATARRPVGADRGTCGSEAHRGETAIASDIAHDPDWEDCRVSALAAGLRACWSMPIRGQARPVLGVFSTYFSEARHPTARELEFLERVTNLAKIAIERHEAEQRIRQLAHFDELTGFPNRVMFDQSLDHAVQQARRAGSSLALLFVDIDRFKKINDTLGHAAGDRLLRLMADRLKQCLRASDLVARFGGDEFMVLLENLPDRQYAATVADKLLEVIAKPLALGDQELHMSASIGISTYPVDGNDAQTLQKNADIAMYRAKDQGRSGWHYYSSTTDTHTLERLTLESQLRRALEREELVLHYQPKQDIASGQITGMEALVRWNHPELGMIAPDRFIPLAEETGLIVALGEWVLRRACAQTRELQGMAGIAPLRVAVNLSARQFSDDRLIGVVSDALRESGLEARDVELEITESMVMYKPEHAAKVLARVKEMGVQVAMDDFGTGYSSLAYLKRFPIDSIKIDRSFIQGIPGDADDSTLTQAIVAMAHSLRLRTIAEGVETGQQLDFLRRHQCDEMQGYYFSRPLPFQQLVEKLRSYARTQPQTPRKTDLPPIIVWP